MDRNLGAVFANIAELKASLSARRAWIEIGSAWVQEFPELVALRKESVDRNTILCCLKRETLLLSLSARRAWIEMIDNLTQGVFNLSLSARRAWIEILVFARQVWLTCVALRKESVDRNDIRHTTSTRPSIVALRKESVDRNLFRALAWKLMVYRRSPQGERG